MATATMSKIQQYLDPKAESLLGFKSPKIAEERLHLPGPDFIDRIYSLTDRNLRVLANLHRLFNTGRLAGTGTRATELFGHQQAGHAQVGGQRVPEAGKILRRRVVHACYRFRWAPVGEQPPDAVPQRFLGI